MKEHPMIFSTDSVKAILNGRKTQTMRVIKPQPPETILRPMMLAKDPASPSGYSFISDEYDDILLKCPYGQVGDRLWVREAWQHIKAGIAYKASWDGKPDWSWKSPLFMSRKRSRITLEITDIRVKKLQEIGYNDLVREGVEDTFPVLALYGTVFVPALYSDIFKETITKFGQLWDSLNAKRGYSWATNPWVWVISFRLLKCD